MKRRTQLRIISLMLFIIGAMLTQTWIPQEAFVGLIALWASMKIDDFITEITTLERRIQEAKEIRKMIDKLILKKEKKNEQN